MKKKWLGAAFAAALVAAGVYVLLFSYPVDEAVFVERGWGSDPDAALRAASTSGQPVLLKFGSHG